MAPGTLKDESKLPELLSGMSCLDIDILGISETHWTKELEESFEENQHVIIQSSRNDLIHRQGVAVVMKKEVSAFMTDFELVSERIMKITLALEDGPLTVFQTYTPDTSYSEVDINLFFESLQDKIDQVPTRHKLFIMGDFNASGQRSPP